MHRYLPVKENHFSAEHGHYISYGIRAVDAKGRECAYVSDIWLDENTAAVLCKLYTEKELSILHLQDVIEDVL